MKTSAEGLSLFQIDAELDEIVEEAQSLNMPNEKLPNELLDRLQVFCREYEEKADRIGHFIRIMESREQYCRQEAARLLDRARVAEGKVRRTKAMVMYLLMKRGLYRLEGRQFTFRIQSNSQASVRIFDEGAVPIGNKRIELSVTGAMWETVLSFLPDELATALQNTIGAMVPDTDAIRAAASRNESVPGAEVKRGYHLRVV